MQKKKILLLIFNLIALLNRSVIADNALQNELPLVVVMPSYNNAERYRLTLDSVFSQKYDNFRLVYIDDGSPDGTGDLVEQYIKEHGLEYKCTLIRNKERCRKLKNIYNAIHACDDREIVVQIDGDDWLAHNQVFAEINKIYQTSDVWLTYGQYRNEPKEEVEKWDKEERGFCAPTPPHIIENRQFRKDKWLFGHLHTFYTWLFKLIKLEDLLTNNIPSYTGKFYPASNDRAIMYPMLEIAHHHFIFIPDICYIRNLYSPIITSKIELELQDISWHEIIEKPRYSIVKEPIMGQIETLNNVKADVIIFSHCNPLGLSLTLESIYNYVSGINNIHVIYSTDNPDTMNMYKKIEQNFPYARYIKLSHTSNNMRSCIFNYISDFSSDYILLAKDSLIINNEIDFNRCIKLLEQTFAYAFYLNLNRYETSFYNNNYQENLVPCQHIIDDVYAWKFHCNSKIWSSSNIIEKKCYRRGNKMWYLFNNIDMTLYRKKDVLNALEHLYYNSLATLEDSWNKIAVDLNKVGLFFEQSKVIQIF